MYTFHMILVIRQGQTKYTMSPFQNIFNIDIHTKKLIFESNNKNFMHLNLLLKVWNFSKYSQKKSCAHKYIILKIISFCFIHHKLISSKCNILNALHYEFGEIVMSIFHAEISNSTCKDMCIQESLWMTFIAYLRGQVVITHLKFLK